MQANLAYGQNKGTLLPGQAISVGKYNVQVERYLSQGGFAHVYLVRTATPVYNTTHHVLKRIAVANEAMLTEVKKEVDIMRLLKGHPNIVHLIDAAWHALPNGVFEVFILMEFCPGGGIIDMMNRRLRERLTEAEILQIFVDVCEGVAYMHNSRPALLHRDLKVENILQASPMSFKLCDFGSATTVSRSPTTMVEIRAVEADLNRHTTLQYRAPEMVDPYMRRPIDEKSDVWALGVLLYKLCYYTTPFEEHGPLAILNVQYRIPPYPVYSPQMHALIASMLREHGAHRPTVFELLSQVHALRGTKSAFTYKLPPPPLSPRKTTTQSTPQRVPQPTSHRPEHTGAASSMPPSTSDSKSNGIQAREKVLEAIAPMRRGRPGTADSPNPSQSNNWLVNEEKAWQAATASSKASEPSIPKKAEDAWSVRDARNSAPSEKEGNTFGDNFAEKLWVEFEPKTQPSAPAVPRKPVQSSPQPAPVPSTSKSRDAFEGLGLVVAPTEKAPTLGEARKLRTGLAVVTPSSNSAHLGDTKNTYPTTRPLPSPTPNQPPSRSPRPASRSPQPPAKPPETWSTTSSADTPIETRFPSLEELDNKFGKLDTASQRQPLLAKPSEKLHAPTYRHVPQASGDTKGKPDTLGPPHGSSSNDGTRSQQITGVAMRETRPGVSAAPVQSSPSKAPEPAETGVSSRPSLTRKFRSSVSIKAAAASPGETDLPRLPPRPPKDWLTGDDTVESISREPPVPSRSPDQPRLRESPSKRASYVIQGDMKLPQALSAQTHTLPSFSPAPPNSPPASTVPVSVARTTQTFPSLEGESQSKPSIPPTRFTAEPVSDSGSSGDEGPEEAHAALPPLRKTELSTGVTKPKARQNSVHDLVDLWGGGSDPSKLKKEKPSSLELDKVRTLTSPVKPPGQISPSISEGKKVGPESRARPQSMFVFPSKPEPVKEPESLDVPDVPKPRTAARRTSITNMVQKYEAIGGRSRLPGATPSVSSTTLSPVERKISAEHPSPSKTHFRSGSIPVVSDIKLSTPKAPVTGVPRTSPGLTSPSPVNLPRTSPIDRTTFSEESRLTRASNNSATRPPFMRQDINPSTASSAKLASVPDSTRSPSPERPYQGVGKLIDQWQKKAAETDQSTPVRRGLKRSVVTQGQ